MRIMGQKPVGPTAFREYLRVVRGLLDGQEVDYTLNCETWPIRFQDRELECVNLDDRVPIYVGANGPKALAATGAYGDGRVSAGTEPTRVMQNICNFTNRKIRLVLEQSATLRSSDIGVLEHFFLLIFP